MKIISGFSEDSGGDGNRIGGERKIRGLKRHSEPNSTLVFWVFLVMMFSLLF